MRELKFRQPIFDNGKFKEFHYWGINIAHGEAIGNIGWATYKKDITDPANSQQFTGRLSKNGLPIFEGDRVKIIKIKIKLNSDEDSDMDWVKIEYTSIIEYRDHGFWVKDEHFGWEGEELWDWEDMEVIGHIYE